MKMVFQGQEKEVEPVSFTELENPWSEYSLPDGSILRVRQVLGAVYRVEGETTDDGLPVYIIRSQTAVILRETGEDEAGAEE